MGVHPIWELPEKLFGCGKFGDWLRPLPQIDIKRFIKREKKQKNA
jgi:hypothetical protein